jgi:hypothetical protein
VVEAGLKEKNYSQTSSALNSTKLTVFSRVADDFLGGNIRLSFFIESDYFNSVSLVRGLIGNENSVSLPIVDVLALPLLARDVSTPQHSVLESGSVVIDLGHGSPRNDQIVWGRALSFNIVRVFGWNSRLSGANF